MTIKKGLYNFYLPLPNNHDIKKIWMPKNPSEIIADIDKIFYFNITIVKKEFL